MDRDLEILNFLWKWKLVSTAAISARFFAGKHRAAGYKALNHLQKCKLVEHYQAARLRNEAKRPVESLSEEELRSFLEALRTGRSPHHYSMALVQFGLGLRIGEVCGLCWESIDLTQGMAIIDRQIEWDQKTWKPSLKRRPKNGRIRYVSIPEAVAEELAQLKAKSDPRVPYVFHRNGMPFTRNKVGPAYNRALRRIGITRVSGTHLLRKTSGTLGTDQTGNFFAVSQFLGHASPQETLRYVKPLSSQKVEVARALDAVLKRSAPLSPNPEKEAAARDKHLEPNANRRALPHPDEHRDSGGLIEEKNVPQETAPVPQCPPAGERPRLRLVKLEG